MFYHIIGILWDGFINKSEKCVMHLYSAPFTLIPLNKIQCNQLPLDPLHENEQSLAELVTYYNMENINQRSSQEAHCKSGGASEICCSGRRENLFAGQLLVVHFTNMAFIEKWQVGR
ncbi:hypothetical protein GOODEAATRI_017192 [Goodea atripinnis]|uniref:Uncharacterized protein n=1 Tax=Goodea atripinnis TaxID=208336 RepID=A0ABV0MIJ8_9TELE